MIFKVVLRHIRCLDENGNEVDITSEDDDDEGRVKPEEMAHKEELVNDMEVEDSTLLEDEEA